MELNASLPAHQGPRALARARAAHILAEVREQRPREGQIARGQGNISLPS